MKRDICYLLIGLIAVSAISSMLSVRHTNQINAMERRLQDVEQREVEVQKTFTRIFELMLVIQQRQGWLPWGAPNHLATNVVVTNNVIQPFDRRP